MNTSITLRAMAARAAVLLLVFTPLFGCAVVKINRGATNSIEHGGGEAVGRDLANRACHEAKAVRAEVLSTVKKGADTAKEEKGRYVTTFRCIY